MRGPQPLPSRVIEVSAKGSPQTVKIRDSRGQFGTYAALSYCWGICPQIRTTKSTLAEHFRGVRVSMLPETIQDAIKLCRSLEIPYLWVDSLCIVQDDLEDWHHEATQMAAIYGRATLTITTPQNSQCDEGFSTLGNDRTRESTHSPWMTRGWTLQEWLLSPRVLHCGSERVWDCYQTWYTETHLTISSPSGALNGTDSASLDTHWSRLVEHFTSRTLSRAMDKLPAIAGLATKFMEHSHAKAPGAIYLAGLWYYKGINPFGGHTYPTSQLPLGLLWRRAGVESMQSPGMYRAPSWSWSALDGPADSDVGSKICYMLIRPTWLIFSGPVSVDHR
ncbi:heterokaryon incompatibility protein-domain-containing protein [Diaporthe sp. PMI_573]|nr:heterokaryon incompatibility protein-domain-containing protein [Diaporthaceae sp. PMI_573]